MLGNFPLSWRVLGPRARTSEVRCVVGVRPSVFVLLVGPVHARRCRGWTACRPDVHATLPRRSGEGGGIEGTDFGGSRSRSLRSGVLTVTCVTSESTNTRIHVVQTRIHEGQVGLIAERPRVAELKLISTFCGRNLSVGLPSLWRAQP